MPDLIEKYSAPPAMHETNLHYFASIVGFMIVRGTGVNVRVMPIIHFGGTMRA